MLPQGEFSIIDLVVVFGGISLADLRVLILLLLQGFQMPLRMVLLMSNPIDRIQKIAVARSTVADP